MKSTKNSISLRNDKRRLSLRTTVSLNEKYLITVRYNFLCSGVRFRKGGTLLCSQQEALETIKFLKARTRGLQLECFLGEIISTKITEKETLWDFIANGRVHLINEMSHGRSF